MKLLFPYTLLIIFISCQSKSNRNVVPINWFGTYSNDPGDTSMPVVYIFHLHNTYQIIYETKNGLVRQNFDSLTNNQGFEWFPPILYVNNEFICLMTNSSGASHQRLYLPRDSTVSPRFFKEQVIYADTVENIVAFIAHYSFDHIYMDMDIGIENLNNGKKIKQHIQFACYHEFPFIKNVERNGDQIIIHLPCDWEGNKTIDISELFKIQNEKEWQINFAH